ncbi:MAG: hypothetical protein AAF333_16815 [Planctomycetota bacterium]
MTRLSRFNPTPQLLLAAGLVIGLCATPYVRAQDDPGLSEPVRVESLMSDMLLRLTLRAVAQTSTEGIRPDQITRAEILLDLATELSPDDAELWAMRANLALQAEDPAARLAALRRYVELRPQDDAYHLDLIIGELADVETLDGRLAILEDHIDRAQAEGYTDPLRSRLASAAAAIARELDDNERFLKNLKIAVRADSANGEAAALTFQLAKERNAPPVKAAAAAINLVRSSPLASESRLVMAQSLSEVAVFDRACEQFEVATRLPRTELLPEAFLMTWARCLIADGQKGRAEQLFAQIDRIYSGVPIVDDTGETIPAEPKPIPIEVHLMKRVLWGESPRGQKAYEAAVEAIQGLIDSGDSGATLELAWVMALFGPDTESVADLLSGQDQDDPRYHRATGFVYMREGAERWARDAFESVASEDDIAAYGLALLQGRDDAGRARFLREVVHSSPDRFGGLLAAHQLHEMRREVLPGSEGQRIIDAMNRLPIGLWRYDTQRNPWVTIRASFDELRTQYLQPIHATLVLQNAMSIALPVNPQVGLGKTALVSVAAYSGGQGIGQLPPVVMDLGRRLTLEPNERWEIKQRIDLSIFGLFLLANSPSTLTYNTTFMVSPQTAPNGGLTAGPLGGIDTVRSVQAFVPGYSEANLNLWADLAQNGDGQSQFAALALLSRVGEGLTQSEIDPQLSRRCIDAVNQTFENSGPVARAWILSMLPPQDNNRSEFQTVLDLAQRSDDPLVRIVYLSNQVREPDGRPITTAIRDGSPRVQRFAEALREALNQPPPETQEPAEAP